MNRLYVHGIGTMALGHDAPLGSSTAMLETLPIKTYVPPKKSRRFGRLSKMVYIAGQRALENAKVAAPEAIPVINATCVGEAAASIGLLEQIHRTRGKTISPALVPNSVHNAPAGYLTIGLGNLAPSITVSQGWLSSEAGLAAAADWLSIGVADQILVLSGDEADPAWETRLREQGAAALADELANEAFQEGAVGMVVGQHPADPGLGSVVAGLERRPDTAAGISALLGRLGVIPGSGATVRVRTNAGGAALRGAVAEALGRSERDIALDDRGAGTTQAYALNALVSAIRDDTVDELLLVGAEVGDLALLHWVRAPKL